MCWDMWAQLIYRWGSFFRGLGGKHSQSSGTGSSRLLGEACGFMEWCLNSMLGDEVWTLLFAEKLWGSNFSALSRSWTTQSLSPPVAGTSQTLQLPHPNHQITRGLCVIYDRALASNTQVLAVRPGPKYFCRWSSAPSFNSRDNICYSHTFRPERMFIMC